MVRQITINRRNRVTEHLRKHGPLHCSEIWQALGIPRGSIYGVLRCELFEQLDDSRWVLFIGH